jgi:predicted regulator of Ras-like GTPase activity (Roadblock/LC7/MglB family)
MSRLNGDDFVIYPEDLELIAATLQQFCDESECKCVLLVHKNGQLVAKQGFTTNIDTTSLAALAAGAFASTREIARLVGEDEFSVLFQEGKKGNIHVTVAGDHTIMVTVFDDRTTIGMVRLYASQTADKLGQIFAEAAKRPPPDDVFAALAGEEEAAANLFHEQD